MSGNSYKASPVGLCPTIKIESGNTETVLTKSIPLYRQDSINYAVYFRAEGVPSGQSFDVYLQTRFQDEWCDLGEIASVCVDQDGIYGILLSEGVELEALVLPLSHIIRLVAKTDGTIDANISSVTSYGGSYR